MIHVVHALVDLVAETETDTNLILFNQNQKQKRVVFGWPFFFII